MKKEIMILGCLIVIFWGLINFLYGKTNDIDNIQYKLNQNGNIAIMVYDNERESYLKQSNIPVGSYELESEKSYCVNGGEITGYDKTLGVITYNFFTSDKCYIYLKKIDLQTNISLDNNNSVVNYTLEYSKYPVRFVVSYVKNGENSNWTVVQDTVSNSGVVSGSIVANITGEITIKIGVYTIDDELLMTEYQKATVSAINTNTNVLLTNKILSLVSGLDYTSSQTDGGVYRVIEQNGIRYEGKDPNNYIKFNGEEWRIIGIFEGSTIGLTEGKYYTKIIKSDKLSENYQFHSTKPISWATSAIKEYLNGTYYSNLSSGAQGRIVSATWYLGSIDKYEDILTDDIYDLERGTLLPSGMTESALTSQNKVGLIYSSDYGYAMYGGTACDNSTIFIYEYDIKKCANYDWLYLGESYYLINSNATSDHLGYISVINATGSFRTGLGTEERAIRPTAYLNYGTSILIGEGTKANPYYITGAYN